MTPWVRSREELRAFLSPRPAALALDSESDSLHHHREKVCLIQVATPQAACLVDPLPAFRDLEALGELTADPGVVKVLHGADYDVTTLKRDFGFRFANLFDTMIAARFLGLPEVGLQALALRELGVALSKDSQKDDWSRRPLTPAQEAYALADVTHLLDLHARLVGKLRSLGRLEWVQEECDAVAALEPARKGRDPEGWTRIKGVRRLSRRQQAVVRAAHAWREALAESTDIPAFKLMGSEALLALGEKTPRTAGELRGVKGVPPRVQAQGASLLQALEAALRLPEEELPRLPAAPRPVVPEAVRKRVEVLKKWRADEAARLGLDVSVVLPQRLLDPVAERPPRLASELDAVDGFRRWRRQAFGEAITKAANAHG
jgi:ribonuclease D